MSLKPKKGKCVDCPEGSPEKYLTADRCSTHYWQYRKGISDERNKDKVKTVKVRIAIKSKSDKLTAEERAYHTKDKPEYMAEHPICEAKLFCCTHHSTDIHHKKGRGIWLRVKKYFLAVCRSCHDWIEANPEEAKKLNLSVSRLTKE